MKAASWALVGVGVVLVFLGVSYNELFLDWSDRIYGNPEFGLPQVTLCVLGGMSIIGGIVSATRR